MSAFFVEACCHARVEVAMVAADSLRQLATKFLEREELLNYSFQNEFLKPSRRSRGGRGAPPFASSSCGARAR